MDDRMATRLVFHGALVFLLGLVAGFPYAFVLLGTMAGEARAWHMAHLEGVLNGLVCIAVAAVAPRLRLGPRQGALVGWGLVVTAYGNLVASVLGASAGVRGLDLGGTAANTAVYLLFVGAVVTVLVAMALVAVGARGRRP